MSKVDTMRWVDGCLEILDQTLLPGQIKYIKCLDEDVVGEAIYRLSVRGAPAIGAAAAYGLCLGALAVDTNDPEQFQRQVRQIAAKLVATRPTAVNLKWAVDRLLHVLDSHTGDVPRFKQLLLAEANDIFHQDVEANTKMGEHGQSLVPDKASILTHCNAGALATAGVGTALGVVRAAKQAGKKVQVYADETRPLLQGARLTTWEMLQEDIPVTLITDNMAGYLMAQGLVDLVIVGADRIAANGDTANKIGTYSVAVLAQKHAIPFYVAAPLSTIDFNLTRGQDIPIEFRDEKEITHWAGVPVAPPGVKVWNPAFDVTPADLITAIITEEGIARAPFTAALGQMKDKQTKIKN